MPVRSGYGSQFIRAYTMRDESWTREAPGSEIPFTASSAARAKDQMVLSPERWRVDNYHRGGGPVLWQHDHSRPAIGNGKATVEPKRLRIHVVFDQEDEFARGIESKLRRRVLRSSSVGWCFVDGAGDVLPNQRISPYAIANQAYQSLDEMSVVNVGSDPFAVAERAAQAQALRWLGPNFVQLHEAMEREDSDVTGPEIRAALLAYCRTLGLDLGHIRAADADHEDDGPNTEVDEVDGENTEEPGENSEPEQEPGKRSAAPTVDEKAANLLLSAFAPLVRA